MSSEFSYPSFRCILEYLEANKRIHVCSRSKALRKIDKKIPIHIKLLELSGGYFTVNDITILLTFESEIFNNREQVLVDGVFRDWNQVMMPGDVCSEDGEFYKLPNTENLEIRNQGPVKLYFLRDKSENRRVLPNMPHDIAMKKIATVLFGGRSLIHVSELRIYNPLLRLPVGLNIRIRNILNFCSDNLNGIVCIIDPQSFPLKTIKITPNTPENYYHPIVQTAETLDTWPDEMSFFREPWHREVLTMPHKHLKLKIFGSVHEDIVSMVQHWLDHPRDHGRTLALAVWDSKGGMVKSLYQIKNQFNGKVALIPEDYNKRVSTKAIIIPINSTSELLVCSLGDKEIKLESVPTGKVQSSNSMYLTYLDFKWSLSSRIQEYSEKRFIKVIFSIFMFIFAFGTIFHAFYNF